MKLLYTFLPLLALISFSFQGLAQVATIGLGATVTASTGNWGPIYRSSSTSAFDYSQHYFLYTQTELAAAGIFPGTQIQSVGWNKVSTFGTDPGNTQSSWKIYMKNSSTTPGATWSNANFAVQNAGAVLVYANASQIIPPTVGWITLNLQTPFTYTGGSLEIGSDWDCSLATGNPSTGVFAFARDALTNQVFGSSNSTATMNMTLQTQRPQIQLGYVAGAACSGTPNAGTTTASSNPVCPATPYTLSLSGATSATGLTYQWQSSTDGISYNDISGATNSSYSSSQTTDTYYRCIVVCAASLQSDTATPVMVATSSFLNCYCSSNATSSLDEEIINVTISTLNNSSTCSTTGGAGSTLNRYSNYTALPAPNLARTVDYQMSVDIGTCGGNFNSMTKVFIDFNQNGLLTDAGDLVYTTPTATNGPHLLNFTVSIPVTAVLGTTLMRIVNVETTSAANVNPCGTYTYGETEDYYVNIAPTPTCPQPTALTVLGNTTSSVSLDWTAGGAETIWQLQYGASGFAIGTGTTVTVSSASDTTLGGLTPYSFFDVYVRGICGAGDTSFWAPKKKFDTYGLGQYMELDLVCAPGGFTDISATAASNALITDGEAGFSLPWPFYFQGTEVNQITVGNNGAVVFNSITAQISPTNANTMASSAAVGLYPFWDDMDDNTGMVYYGSVGTAPNRQFIVQWNMKHDLFLSGVPFVYQLVMEEGTGKVYYQYQNKVTGSATYDHGASATIGISGPNQDFTLSFNNATFLQSNSCASFYYTNCPKPTNLIYNYIYSDEAAISWTAGLAGETNWTIIYGPAGFDPTTSGTTITTTPNPNEILSNLTQLTTYDVYIYSDCAAGSQSFALKSTFTTLPLCSNPTNFSASTDVDSIYSSWSWSAAGSTYIADGFELNYGIPGFDPLVDGTVFSADVVPGDTIVDTNLYASGVYEIYVRSVCDTLVSGYVGPITITMPLTNDLVCAPQELPIDGISRVFSNVGAGTQANESTIAPPVTGNTSTTGWGNNTLSFTNWYKFKAPASGEMRIDATSRSFNGQIAVYQAITCADFTSFTLLAANDDAIGGGSLAPNFTICGLTPGADYFLLFDSQSTTATGQYALKLSSIDLDAGVSGSLVKICYSDTANLFDGIGGYQAGGVWNDIDGTFKIVNDSMFRTTGVAPGVYQFEYELTDGCASDAVIGTYEVYPRSSAGTNGGLTICRNEPFSAVSALGGTFMSGGQWYNAQGNAINSPNVPTGTLSVPGNYIYQYIVGNGVCPNDSSIVTVSVLSSCNFLGLEEEMLAQVTLYPNPTLGMFTMEFPELSSESQIQIIDMSGRVVDNKTLLKGTTNFDYNLQYVEPGVYVVKLKGEGFELNLRVSKN